MKVKKKVLSLGLMVTILVSNYIVVSNAMELKNIEKIVGKNRYETAALIADKQNYTTAILVNSDKSIADGLSASGLAGSENAPILLTQKDNIPDETLQRLNRVTKLYIVGGEDSINKDVEQTLTMRRMEVKRISGNDRIETSYNVAKEINSVNKVKNIILTNAYKGEADSMSVASVAVRDKMPIILTNGDKIPFNTDGLKTYIVGGKSSMSDTLVNETKSIRISGVDRFKTNKEVIKYFYKDVKECYITKAYTLIDALTGSTIAKNKPIVLADEVSDKSVLKGMDKFDVIGGVNNTTINKCLNVLNGEEKETPHFEHNDNSGIQNDNGNEGQYVEMEGEWGDIVADM
ncbi:cell wall-binding repeat-containing protein [Clostridioides sp. ZZV15-6597]|uniref:cell wall-binding repeat-containing protein n=1 Tax=Clostridioides sp. ZZV15-6597 TaxID=2811500 RepID=UPI001C1AB09C|nr:cell wall-binding repeat-containing protein [Clostridioides sp. ZZV15-6597]HBF5866255.1 cell wall-binding repeat-containing protein [Clostridioides difficile]